MPEATPLHLLLNGMVAHNQDRIDEASLTIRNYVAGAGIINQCVPNRLSRCFLHFESCSRAREEEGLVYQLLSFDSSVASVTSCKDGSFPLHYASLLGNTRIFQMVHSVRPEAARAPNRKGKLPLHLAAREGHLNIVRFLLQMYPQAAAIPTFKLKLPLHFSAAEGHVEISRLLLSTFPMGARNMSTKGKLPLHLASRRGQVELARLLLHFYPEGTKGLDWEGSLPLHEATLRNQEKMVELLMDVNPAGLETCNIRGEIPLFAAVRSNNTSLVHAMLMIYPEGGKRALQSLNEDDHLDFLNWEVVELCIRGAAGMISLSRSAADTDSAGCFSLKRDSMQSGDQHKLQERAFLPNHSDTATMKNSLQSEMVLLPNRMKRSFSGRTCTIDNPNEHEVDETSLMKTMNSCTPASGVRKRVRLEKREFLPLHAAIQCGASLPILRRVLKRQRDQISVKDLNGLLPLHAAAASHHESSALFVKELLKLYPQGAHVRDNFNRLAFHIALMNQAKFNMIKPLLDANVLSGHEVCHTYDENFEDLPVFVALRMGCELDVIYSLLRGDPNVVSNLI